MKPQVVFALYRAKPGKEEELKKMITKHIPTLKRLELVTDREPILLQSSNGTFVEVMEWRNTDSARKAHEHPEVAAVWEAMGQIADFPSLDSIPEAKTRFPNFSHVQF
jgi:hypothetical protein